MRIIPAYPVHEAGVKHGEGPVWDPASHRLYFTDLMAGVMHWYEPATERSGHHDLGTPLGAFARRREGGWVVAVEAGFGFFDEAAGLQMVAPVDYGPGPKVRMNDGKCDAEGRFWAGTMAYDQTPGRAALYVFDGATVRTVLTGCTISNGLDWTDDGRLMYYIDSPTERVDAFDFRLESGMLTERRPLVELAIPPVASGGQTVPDGMTLDADGHVWVAVWGSGTVRRYSPSGELEVVVELPVACPTSVAFGGPDLDDLYITTMQAEASAGASAETSREDLAGALFQVRPGVAGRYANLFGPVPD